MSSKKKTTETQTSTSTMTPTNPEWVMNGAHDLSTLISNLSGRDPQSFVAGPTPLQTQQFGLAGGLGEQGAGWLGQAADMATAAGGSAPVSHATAQTAYPGIGNYLNPYLGYVAGNALGDMGRALQIAQTGSGRDALLASQYGGSRQGVVDANLNRDFFDRAGSTLGNIYSGGFNTALGAADSDANRAQQTSIFNAGAGNAAALAAQQAQLQGAGVLSGLGQYGVGALGQAAGSQYGISQAQAGAPLTALQALTGAYGSLPLNLFQGNTTTQTGKNTSVAQGGWMDGLGNALSIGSQVGAFLSDGRLKRDISTAGFDRKGRRWVDFNYLWDAPDAPKRRGVIAQEVADTDAEAVGWHPEGYLVVDYSKLEA